MEKYLSPEEQQRQEETRKLEEERRLAEMVRVAHTAQCFQCTHTYTLTFSHMDTQGDNPRERALDMMMGGRLEANVEEDLFKVKTIINTCCTTTVCVYVCVL